MIDANKNLRAAYSWHKSRAKRRGIPWEFSFDGWLAAWESSGKLAMRGRGAGKYAMARKGDVGPYSASNIEIILHEKNSSDARANHPKTAAEHAANQLGRGRGWTRVNNRFQVVVSHKYVGLFKSVELAKAAYKAAVARELDKGGAGK